MTTVGEQIRNIYVASSWRNPMHIAVVAALQAVRQFEDGSGRVPFESVYDFRHPTPGNEGFRWTDIDPSWSSVNGADGITNPDAYLAAIQDPVAVAGFDADFAAMQAADTFILVLPCGRSAHLELGWAVGQGKRTVVMLDDPVTPELMYRMVDYIAADLFDLLGWLGVKD